MSKMKSLKFKKAISFARGLLQQQNMYPRTVTKGGSAIWRREQGSTAREVNETTKKDIG